MTANLVKPFTIFVAAAIATLLCTVRADCAEKFPPVAALPVVKELPDPLVMFNGKKVTSREQWFNERRPELKALFQHYMYGYLPPPPKEIKATAERTDAKYFGGKATKKEIVISYGPPQAPKISLLLVVPNHSVGPKPVFLGINFCGNHTLLDDPSIALPGANVRTMQCQPRLPVTECVG